MNTANKITLARIFSVPVAVAVYLIEFPWNNVIACALFTLCASTDFIDGYIARSRNQVTDLGKFLDPIADKILVTVFLFLLVNEGILAAPWGAIICGVVISRELIISAFRTIALKKNIVMAADVLGKLKTDFLDVGIAILIICTDVIFDRPDKISQFLGNFFYYSGTIIFYIGCALAVISGLNYVLKNKAVLQAVKEDANIVANSNVDTEKESMSISANGDNLDIFNNDTDGGVDVEKNK